MFACSAPTRGLPLPSFFSASFGALFLLSGVLAAGVVRAAPAHAVAGTFLIEGRAALPPMAYLRFCKAYPGECAAPADDAPATRRGERLSELRRVNREANARIRPVVRVPGAAWLLEARSGDCNTYAVQKRHMLLKAGWPLATLSLAVVVTAMGEGHLVLVARTGAGDFVLDNLRRDVRSWNATGYAWRKIQSVRDASTWVDVAADRSATAPALGEEFQRSDPARRIHVADGN